MPTCACACMRALCQLSTLYHEIFAIIMIYFRLQDEVCGSVVLLIGVTIETHMRAIVANAQHIAVIVVDYYTYITSNMNSKKTVS